MQPPDADSYFGKVLRDARPATRTGRAAALSVFLEFLELRHKVELHNHAVARLAAPRLVPLINGADRNLRWFIDDVWAQFDADHFRSGAPAVPVRT